MLVETEGVSVYTLGRGNFEAAKTGEQAVRRQVGKAETLARSTTRLRCASRRFVGRNGKAEAAKLPGAGMMAKGRGDGATWGRLFRQGRRWHIRSANWSACLFRSV